MLTTILPYPTRLSHQQGTIDFGNYNHYGTWPFQVLGVTSALLVFGIVFIGLLDDKLFDVFISDRDSSDKNEAWVDVEMKVQRNATLEQSEPGTDYSNMDDTETPKEAAVAASALNDSVLT